MLQNNLSNNGYPLRTIDFGKGDLIVVVPYFLYSAQKISPIYRVQGLIPVDFQGLWIDKIIRKMRRTKLGKI